MRVIICGNSPLTHTGYGAQTRLMVPRFQALGHPTAVHAFYGCEGGVLQYENTRLYPRFVHPFGQDIVAAHAQNFGADAIMTFTDAWVMEPQQYQGIPWLAYAPIDHEPAPAVVIEKLKHAFQPIAYSKFGFEMMAQAGLTPMYVPHCVDTKLFAPMDRAAARQQLGWPTDAFVVGMVAANKGIAPIRKCFVEQIEAFARFKRRHPDAILYLHTNLDQPEAWQPVPLSLWIAHHGLKLGRDVLAVDQYQYFCGSIGDEQMATMYNALDVFMNVSRGEGFGVPALEAQACGTPIITGGWTAMPELCFSGWAIPKDEAEPDPTPQHSYMWKPRVGAIAQRLEWAFKQSGDQRLRESAREGALRYDADLVAEQYWRPVLADIESRLSAPVCVGEPLNVAA